MGPNYPKVTLRFDEVRLELNYPRFTPRRKPLDSFAVRSATLDATLTFEPRHGAS